MAKISAPLTVGVPVYNSEKFLERCLANLCAEDLEYNIIISDNASTDKTEDISRAFAASDKRIRYIRQEENIGAERNFRFLLDNADSEFFAWRAYDDFSSKGYFEKLSNILAADNKLHLAVGSLEFESEEAKLPKKCALPASLPQDNGKRRKLLLKIATPAWIYGVFRHNQLQRRFVDASNAFNYTWALDTLTLLPFLLEASVAVEPDVVFTEYLCNLSAKRYRPKGVIPASRFVGNFCRHGFLIADELAQSQWEKFQMYLEIIRYSNKRCMKFHRIAKRAVLWHYYKINGRL